VGRRSSLDAEIDMAVTGKSLLRRIFSGQGRTAIGHYFVMDWISIWKDIAGGLLACPSPRSLGATTGLGQTNPPQSTGQPAATAASTVTTFGIDFNYRPNALATKPAGPSLTGAPSSGVTPLFSGTTPGFVGLYQTNFIVPSPPLDFSLAPARERRRRIPT
jgi:hypothetical protein